MALMCMYGSIPKAISPPPPPPNWAFTRTVNFFRCLTKFPTLWVEFKVLHWLWLITRYISLPVWPQMSLCAWFLLYWLLTFPRALSNNRRHLPKTLTPKELIPRVPINKYISYIIQYNNIRFIKRRKGRWWRYGVQNLFHWFWMLTKMLSMVKCTQIPTTWNWRGWNTWVLPGGD